MVGNSNIRSRHRDDAETRSVVIDNAASLAHVPSPTASSIIVAVAGNKYYIIHGDVFDLITTKFKFISKLGGLAYDFLIWLNRVYNKWRIKKGKGEYSLSKAVKSKVKAAVNFVSDFENVLSVYTESRGYDAVICGHIHHPEIKKINNTLYLNSGDWVENLTALVETHEGEWKILHYNEIEKERNENTLCDSSDR